HRAGLRWLLAPALVGAAVLAFLLGPRISRAPDTAEAATVLTVLGGEVQVQTSSGLLAGRSGMALREGDRVVTGEDGRAVLSFVDGSSVTLDQKTEILIRTAGSSTGTAQVKLDQRTGNTWTDVPATLAPG